MTKPESPEERKKRFKNLSSFERKIIIREKLKRQGLSEGSRVKEKDQTKYNNEEMIDLILLTECFQKIEFKNSPDKR